MCTNVRVNNNSTTLPAPLVPSALAAAATAAAAFAVSSAAARERFRSLSVLKNTKKI
jgi:hypothetical protein